MSGQPRRRQEANMTTRWADIDADWKRKEERALAQRAANAAAVGTGEPLPFPNPWDVLDPTKLPRDAPPEAYRQRYLEFCKLCPPKKPRRHTI